MKIGLRTPSIKKRISARTTGALKRKIKKQVIPFYGTKGTGFIKNPKKAMYNKVYNKLTFSVDDVGKSLLKNVNTNSNRSSNQTNNFNSGKKPPNFWKKLLIIFLILMFLPLAPAIIATIFIKKSQNMKKNIKTISITLIWLLNFGIIGSLPETNKVTEVASIEETTKVSEPTTIEETIITTEIPSEQTTQIVTEPTTVLTTLDTTVEITQSTTIVEPTTQIITNSKNSYLGNSNSLIFHMAKSTQKHVTKIKPEYRIMFDSTEEAKTKGYRPCETCFK